MRAVLILLKSIQTEVSFDHSNVPHPNLHETVLNSTKAKAKLELPFPLFKCVSPLHKILEKSTGLTIAIEQT
jgi:hypothetical protein